MSDKMSGSDVDEGRAVPIVDVERDGKLRLHLDALNDIVNSDAIRHLPVIVVSVAGDYRLGKSFLLNLFLRYLDRYDDECPKSWIGDPEEGIGCRFQWQGGEDLVTKGILMWNQPHIRKIDGKEVAILLIDTQGYFDFETKRDGTYKIFALSTLMSSIQLFNENMTLKSKTLESLHAFLSYTRRCGNSENGPALFQKLLFVARDWRASIETYGLEGGECYLKNCLASYKKNENSGRAPPLVTSFTDVECFLLPHPGMAVHNCKNSSDLCVKDIAEDFVDQVADLAKLIFSKSSHIKQLGDNNAVITGRRFYDYLEKLQENINSDKLPAIRTTLEYMIILACEEKEKSAMELFKGETKTIAGQLKDYCPVTRDELENVLGIAEKKALDEFNECYEANSPIHNETKNILQKKIENIKGKMIARQQEIAKIQNACATQKEKAMKKFENLTQAITISLRDGYDKPPDDIDVKLQQAATKARELFDEVDGRGSQIYIDAKNELKTDLEATIENLKSDNRDNERIITSLKRKCEQGKNDLKDNLDQAHGFFTKKSKLKQVYKSAKKSLPSGQDTKATQEVLEETLSNMEKSYRSHEAKYEKREMRKDGACVAAGGFLIGAGIVTLVCVGPEVAVAFGAFSVVSFARPIGRSAKAWIKTRYRKGKHD